MNVLTIDFEDWFTTSHYKNVVNSTNAKYLLKEPTLKILDVLEKHKTQATFFVLGQVAKDCPNLVKEISNRGHEIASHGFFHKRLDNLSPEDFHQEIKISKQILEDITSKKVVGFRAPFFSLSQRTAWTIDILNEEGFLYDSSIFSMKTTRYGIDNAPQKPYFIKSANITVPHTTGSLLEFPIPIWKIGPLRIPFSGGIYARFLPSVLLNKLLQQANSAGYINFFFHPWEIYNKQKLLPYPGLQKNVLANYQSESYLKKIEKIIQKIEFNSAKSFLDKF